MECLACRGRVTEVELLKCVHCKGNYHHNCVNMTSSFYMANLRDLRTYWQCPACDNVTSRRKGTDTPVRGLNKKRESVGLGQPLSVSCDGKQRSEDLSAVEYSLLDVGLSVDMSCDESLLDSANDVDVGKKNVSQNNTTIPSADAERGSITFADFAALMDLKLSEFRTHLNDHFANLIEGLRRDFSGIIDSVYAQVNALKSDFLSISERTKTVETENALLKVEISKLSAREMNSDSKSLQSLQAGIDERDQMVLLNDLEVTGVPEFKGESTAHIVSAIAVKLGVQLDERDVVHATRVGRAPVLGEAEAGFEEGSRPRPIVVRLVRRAVRDMLLRSARVRRGSTTSDLGLPIHQSRRVFINERLTKKNRVLFGKARELGGKLQWRFVWTRDGRIMARRTETSKIYRIRTEEELHGVFSTPTDTPSNP